MLMQARNAEEYFANKNSFTTGPMELRQRFEDGENMVIVDVRKEEDYRQGHVPGAISLPESQWQTLRGLCADVPNILYGYTQTSHLASRAAQCFARQGFNVVEMDGGFQAWKDAGLEVEK
ncbi:MAG TPA: rhodanese-like domain-containing protein [Verrucomicrobiae bacterium]|jgi:rhodanese-related sulfurtransferase|nr:rhodanese-like domain-containing protein [Verrucomicrobiae bacterium]